MSTPRGVQPVLAEYTVPEQLSFEDSATLIIEKELFKWSEWSIYFGISLFIFLVTPEVPSALSIALLPLILYDGKLIVTHSLSIRRSPL